MSAGRLPCLVRVEPWLKDHAVEGGKRIVLPAVETMLILAAHCDASHPEADIRVMEDVRFGTFFGIPPVATEVPALIEETDCGDRIRLKLLSHVQFKAMARIKEHGEVSFPVRQQSIAAAAVDPAPPARPVAKVGAAHIYGHLVPFGPNYHTLQDTLLLSEGAAWGQLLAPTLPCPSPVRELLGSPFPLDGAMHAACVLGQRLVDFVPFPVGWARRLVHRPTRPGDSYLTRVTLIAKAGDELVFDLKIFNHHGQLYETVSALRMRDVGVSARK